MVLLKPDSYLQWELESSFLFEDTPDQEKYKAIKKIWNRISQWIVLYVEM